MDSPFCDINDKTIPFDEVKYEHLNQLLQFEEGWKFEYKSAYDASVRGKLSKIICSFANCAGGWIFIGIENSTHNVIDIEKPKGEIELNIINSIKRFVDLEVPNLLRAKFIENPTNPNHGVIMIGVQEGLHPPYVANGAIYVRAGAQSDPVPAERSTIDYLYKKSDRTSILLVKALSGGNVQARFTMENVSKHTIFKKMAVSLMEEIDEYLMQNNKMLFSASSMESSKEEKRELPALLAAALIMRGEQVDLSEYLKYHFSLISEYIKARNLTCDIHNIFSFGNLKLYHNAILNTRMTEGTSEEKERFDVIDIVVRKIEKLHSIAPLIAISQFTYRLDLAIANEGNYHDEDITLCLYVPKGSVCDFTNLQLDADANEYNKILEQTMETCPIANVDDYDGYGNYPCSTPSIKSEGFQLVEDKEENLKNDIENELNYLYSPYEIVNFDAKTDVIKIKFNKLNPNQVKRLPAPRQTVRFSFYGKKPPPI